jgi:diguanylate cyclase (GGDEF)-like protein
LSKRARFLWAQKANVYEDAGIAHEMSLPHGRQRLMPLATPKRDSAARQFAAFSVIMLVGVLALGLVLALSYRAEATRRGLAQGRSEAVLMAQTAIDPRLDGRMLSLGLSPTETYDMNRLVQTAVKSHNVLRLRLRDEAGDVIYSNDGSGLHSDAETDDLDEVLDAAHGSISASITRLNADSDDTGPLGPPAVEVYMPLVAGTPAQQVGVLEVYLPYTPIQRDVDAGLDSLYRNLAIGLGLFYLLLVGISFTVGRRLRRQVKLNAYNAEHDALTGLPNRTLFHHMIEDELVRQRGTAKTTMIAIVDLDRFKEVNDTLGHHNGDRLLSALSERLSAHLHGLNALARLGGDEFGILISDVDDPDVMLHQLRAVIEGEVNVGGMPLSVEASIGYVLSPQHGSDVDELLQLADVAMYTAKVRHAGVLAYDASQNHYEASNLTLIAELRTAIETDQLVLYYQPKVRISDGRIDAVEALVRWQHPTRGLLQPDSFIPLAEQTDLIDRLTEWVVRRALFDMQNLGPVAQGLTVSVNVSARNLSSAGFASKIVEALDIANVAPHRLFIEVTETALMTDPIRAAAVLGELDRAGVRLSIDDFGSGQTSLGYLATLPIHELKIDRSFITDMLDHHGHAAIVHSIVDLGHNLGFSVVGEGVETRTVLDELAATGCDVAQGYLFTRPMASDLLIAWLNDYAMAGASSRF